jgi:hypothetical protein
MIFRFSRPLLCLLAAIVPVSMSAAQDAPEGVPEKSGPPPAIKVEKSGDNLFKIGTVEFDSASREIRFPAWVNMQKGMIEFPVVHRNGRAHEAIFATDIHPLELETAFRLLRFAPSKEVFPTYPGVDPKNPPEWDKWPDPVFPAPVPGARVQVFASWTGKDGAKQTADVRGMVVRPVAGTGEDGGKPERLDALAPYWVFTGSEEPMEAVVKPLGGSLVGIRPEKECSMNTVANENIHKAEWFADPERIPAIDTPVTIHIRPAGDKPAPPNPETKPESTKP